MILTTIFAVLQILLMGMCGYILVKKKAIDDVGLGLLTRLLINFLLPIFMFYQFTQHFDFKEYPNWWIFPLISFGVTLVAILTSQLVLFFSRNLLYKKEFVALVAFQNSGYIPLMLVTTMFPEAIASRLYVYIFLFLIGFNASMWTLGVWWLTKDSVKNFKARELLNPPSIAIFVSLFVIYLGWHRYIPEVFIKPMGMFSGCVLPIAMIVVGGSLARIKLTDANPKEIITVIFAKLILLPIFALCFIKFFNVDFFIGALIMIEAVVPSAVSLPIIARHYKVQEKFINQGLLFNHLASMITIPIFLILWMKWTQ